MNFLMLAIVFSIFCFLSPLQAQTLTPQPEVSNSAQGPAFAFDPNPHGVLSQLLANHQEVQTYRYRVESAENLLRQSVGLYLPSLDLSGDYGHEHIKKEYIDSDTNMWRHEVTLRATQLIYDFGKTLGTIDRDTVALAQAHASLDSITQATLRDGITAYIQIVRARERLRTARYSESRIKELTGVEKTLLEKGAGLTSDVLQAKQQLAGAMALRVEAEGELKLAKNHFQAVFYHYPTEEEVNAFIEISLPTAQFPATLEPAVAVAIANNPEIRITKYDLDLTRKDIKISKSAYFPDLNLFGEVISAHDNDGYFGYRYDSSVGVEFTYNLYRGGSDYAAVKSASATKEAASTHLEQAQKLVREQVQNSWDQYLTLSTKKELLDQQTEILRNFLELAKKERKMGTRSLLDVLTGEVNYITAQGTAIAAREDMKIAAYNLLFSMGQMELDLFAQN